MNELSIVRRRPVVIASLVATLVLMIFVAVKLSLSNQKDKTGSAGSQRPGLSAVSGTCPLREGWSVDLPEKFNRRIEDDSVVIWRHGLTLWFSIVNDDRTESKEQRMARIEERVSASAFGKDEINDERLARLCYRLNEGSADGRLPAFYGFVAGDEGHVQMGAYFDDESEAANARNVWLSVRESSAVQARAPQASTRK